MIHSNTWHTIFDRINLNPNICLIIDKKSCKSLEKQILIYSTHRNTILQPIKFKENYVVPTLSTSYIQDTILGNYLGGYLANKDKSFYIFHRFNGYYYLELVTPEDFKGQFSRDVHLPVLYAIDDGFKKEPVEWEEIFKKQEHDPAIKCFVAAEREYIGLIQKYFHYPVSELFCNTDFDTRKILSQIPKINFPLYLFSISRDGSKKITRYSLFFCKNKSNYEEVASYEMKHGS